jgi:hypothetical protein
VWQLGTKKILAKKKFKPNSVMDKGCRKLMEAKG